MFSESKTNLFTVVFLFSFTASAYVSLAERCLKVFAKQFFPVFSLFSSDDGFY